MRYQDVHEVSSSRSREEDFLMGLVIAAGKVLAQALPNGRMQNAALIQSRISQFREIGRERRCDVLGRSR
jgi:hypothetical protein